jgi:hypothetical protein
MRTIAAPADYGDSALERLRFRRQFILGSEPPDPLPGWTRIRVDPIRTAVAHPDLGVCQASSGAKSITLFGYVLDPDDPEATDARVLQRLLTRLRTCGDVFELTTGLGGRWVLVVHDGERTIVVNDAAGMRQVYYSSAGRSGAVVCASQPGLIAECLGLAKHAEAVDFVRSRGDEDNEVYWLPGDRSPYDDVRLMLPNHYLDLGSGKVARYWPSDDLGHLSRAEALSESARLLRGLLQSACLRFRLAISLTAGWDSRLMLALCKDIAPQLYCFTLAYPGKSDRSRDIAVPAALLRKLGLTHHVVRYPDSIDPGFKGVYRRNVSSSTEAYSADAQALYEHYPQDRVCITGDIAEVVKCHLRAPVPGGVRAADLASVLKLKPHPFAIEAFERWLSGATPRNVHPLDLFCWEQMAGRWQAHVRAEYDIVQESCAPLNSRRLLTTMLSVDEEQRRAPDFYFLRELIEGLWAEVLSEPINPRERLGPGQLAARLLTRLHLHKLIPRPLVKLGKRLLRA